MADQDPRPTPEQLQAAKDSRLAREKAIADVKARLDAELAPRETKAKEKSERQNLVTKVTPEFMKRWHASGGTGRVLELIVEKHLVENGF